MIGISSPKHAHDLRLPAWGPYSKKYTGISHLPDLASGLGFDLSVFPGGYRRKVMVPNAKWESGFHPWEASQLLHDELDRFLRYHVQEHVQRVLRVNCQGHCTNAFLRPIEVLPGKKRVLYGMVCSGSLEEVRQALTDLPSDPTALEGVYQRIRAKTVRLDAAPAGQLTILPKNDHHRT